MSCKIVICAILLTLCTINIFHCVASELNSSRSRNIDDLTKIAKGRDVPIEDYPYIVSLQKQFYHHCGGSLVHPLWVLTAAHCISGDPPTKPNQVGHVDTILEASLFKVIAGLTSVSCVLGLYGNDPSTGNPNQRQVIEVHRHEEYVTITDVSTFWNNIALVKLESSFGEEIPVQLAPLAPPDFYEPVTCIAVGWGYQPEVGTCKSPIKREVRPNITSHPHFFIHLRAVEVHNVNTSYCTDKPWNRRFLKETQICLDTRATGNPCKRDSGGPMVCNGKQVGLLSSINEQELELCHINEMAVCIRVAKYQDWIDKFVPTVKEKNVAVAAAVSTRQLDQAFIYLILIMYVMLM